MSKSPSLARFGTFFCRTLCVAATTVFLVTAQARADEDNTFPTSTAFDTSMTLDTAKPAVAALPLLPSRLGPMESVMWS